MTSLSKPCLMLRPMYLRTNLGARLRLNNSQLLRCCSTKPSGLSDKLVQYKPKLVKIGMIGAGCIAFYGISTFVLDMTFFFVNMSPGEVAYYSFVAGFLTAAACGAGIYSLNRFATIRPERVYRESVSLINGSRLLREKLGGDISTEGTLRAYRLERGFLDLDGKKLVWRAPKVHMIFGIAGPKHNGVAVVEASKRGMYNHVRYCGVDILDGSEEHVSLKGESADCAVREQLRDLVSFKPTQIKST